ncbi:glycosyltransferase [Ochrobactrum sp. EDr1-4]|uniref:glycosyltransferase n=1 Tax=Ochrobactrum sp. EDr1-4 TaxID=3368622 RepID=UPI003BA0C094
MVADIIYSQSVAIVIVTYNRPSLLEGLLQSITSLERKPDFVIVIDNNSSEPTKNILRDFSSKELGFELVTKSLDKNMGGAGGFSVGVSEALKTAADWFWLMDDDVIVLPNGLDNMMRWSGQFKCFHAGRKDPDGEHFFCEQWICDSLAVQVPFLKDPYQGKGYFLTNYGCFEGMMIHRDIVNKIGVPDERFFIVWDDAIYGWLASKHTDVAFIADKCLQKVRKQKQISLGLRHLNDSSDLSRYYAIRNRGNIKEYYKKHNCYKPIFFEFGSFLVLAKELIRMLIVEKSIKGFPSILYGLTGRKF